MTTENGLKTKNRKFAHQSGCMEQQLSVLIISGWYPNRTNPTLGNFNEKFAQSTALFNKVDVIHVVADPEMNFPVEYIDQEGDGVHAHYVYFRKRKHESVVDKVIKKLKYFWYYHKAFRRLKMRNGHKPNLVHVHVLYPAGLFALFLKWIYGIPYVVTEHWTGYLQQSFVKQPLMVRWLSRLVSRSASILVPVTSNLQQAMMEQGFRNKYQIVPNVVDARFFHPALSADTKKSVKRILHISSLKDDHKNIRGILRVIKQLSLLRNDFELNIVGDGDASPHIQYSGELQIYGSFVHFHGEMSPLQIAEIMRESDFFLLFSRYENLPCVLVEAFASGLPVVSSNVGGIEEHLTPDKGMLVASEDETALYAALNTMLDTYATYDRQALHTYALAHFSYHEVGKKLDKLYRTIV